MSEAQTSPAGSKHYTGGCHCGAVRYEADIDLGGTLVACNCSMCGRAGTVLTFVAPAQFELKSGADVLTNYQFNKHMIDHVFCSKCGIKSFARGTTKDGAPMIALNVRCLDDVDLESLKVVKVDGKSF